MTRVLLIGIAPDAVNFSDPDLPPGLTADTVAAGIDKALADMKARGWEADFCALRTDDTAEATIAAALRERPDCVIGGGIRMPRSNLLFFERVVNAIGRHAPGTPVAFNTSPEDSTAAAGRWV